MKKKKRICKSGLTYCVRSRCINLEPRMNSPRMKKLMLDILAWAMEKYNFELNGFDIQDCDFIFLIRPLSDDKTISRIMQFVKSQFARKYNALNNRRGPFWNERFYDEIIELNSKPEEFAAFITAEINRSKSEFSSKIIKRVKEVNFLQKKLVLESINGIKFTVSKFLLKDIMAFDHIRAGLENLNFEFMPVQ